MSEENILPKVVNDSEKTSSQELSKNPNEFDIFLSYQWDHKPFVRSLYKKLTELNFKVWMDEVELDDSNLFEQISEGLLNSKLFLCCITKKYAESENCVREFNLAIVNKKPITVLMLERLKMNTEDLKGLCFVLTPLTRFNFYKEIESKSNEVWSSGSFNSMIDAIDKKLVKNELKNEAHITRSKVLKKFVKKKQRQRLGLIIGIVIFVIIAIALSLGLGIGLTRPKPNVIKPPETTTSPSSTINYENLNLNPFFNKTYGLIHYWPFQLNLKDVIGGKNFYDGENYAFIYDKNNNNNSALLLSNGFLQIPSGNYFNDQDFSVLVWVNPKYLFPCSTIFSFSNGLDQGQITFYLGTDGTLNDFPTFQVYSENKTQITIYSRLGAIKVNEWSHLAFVLKFPFVNIFLNATIIGGGVISHKDGLLNQTFMNNTVGYDEYQKNLYNKYTYATFDEMKIFNRSLTIDEIRFEMTNEMYYDMRYNSNQKDVSVYDNLNYNSNYRQSDGLKNYWPFFNSTLDAAGKKHMFNAFITKFVPDRFNQTNAAFYLKSGVIQIPPGNYFPNQDFSLLLWANVPFFHTNYDFLYFNVENDPKSDGIKFSFGYNDPTAGPTFTFYKNGLESLKVICEKEIEFAKWQHIAFVSEDSFFANNFNKNFKIFINGYLACSQAVSLDPFKDIYSYNQLGKKSSGSYYTVNELKIFDRSLSEEEIQSEMNNRIYVSNINENYVQTNGLVNYWPFFRNANDSVGAQNLDLKNGVNAVLTTDRFGNLFSALDLSKGFLRMPPGVYLKANGDCPYFTLMAWVYPRSLDDFSTIMSISNGAKINQIIFLLSDPNNYGFPSIKSYDNLELGMRWYTWYALFSSDPNILLNKWTHITFVFELGNILIYINGSISQNGGFETCFYKEANQTVNFLGKDPVDSTTNTANMIIDEIKIFNKPLTKKEIQFEMINELYSVSSLNNLINQSNASNLNPAYVHTPGLTSYWPFEGNGNDMAGVNDLYAPINISFVSDRNDRSYGAADFSYGFYSLPPDFYISTINFSLLSWINPRSTIKYTPFFHLRYNVDGWSFNELAFYYRNEKGTPSFMYKEEHQIEEFTASQNLTLNKWQHLAFVSDFPKFYFYLDGVKVSQGKYKQIRQLNTKRFLNWIGYDDYQESDMANAIIDELKIFNRSLSLKEVKFEMENDMFI